MTNGKVGWNLSQQSNRESNDFLKLVDGKNKVRFITDAYSYTVHEYQHPNAKYATKIRCSKESSDEKCPLCDAGVKLKTRYFAAVLDRVSNSIKILDFSSLISNGVAEAVHDEDWGPCINYDFTIIKNSKAPSPGEWYKTLPVPKSPLSSAEQSMVDNFKEETLVRLTAAWSFEKTKAKLQKTNEMNGGDPNLFSTKSSSDEVTSFAASTASKPVKKEVVKEESSDDDEEFKEYSE